MKCFAPVWGEDTSEGGASTKTLELTSRVEGSDGRDGRGEGEESKEMALTIFNSDG